MAARYTGQKQVLEGHAKDFEFCFKKGRRNGILQQVSDMITFPRNKLTGFSADYELERGETS